MTLVRWNPAHELSTLHSHMDRILEAAGAAPEWNDTRPAFSPVVDAIEQEDAYVLRAELPGVRKEDVKVHLADNVLTIKGEKPSVTPEVKTQYLHTERAYGSFERSFTLRRPIQSDSVTARFTDGVLEVRVAKSETQRIKEISID